MKTLDELKKKYEELGAEIDRLEKKGGKPNVGDTYYVFGGYSFIWSDDYQDKINWPTNKVFRTREASETHYRILTRAVELIGDWEPDWSDEDQWKRFLYWDHLTNEPRVGFSRESQHQGKLYMPEHAIETLLKEFTDEELRLFICGSRYDD